MPEVDSAGRNGCLQMKGEERVAKRLIKQVRGHLTQTDEERRAASAASLGSSKKSPIGGSTFGGKQRKVGGSIKAQLAGRAGERSVICSVPIRIAANLLSSEQRRRRRRRRFCEWSRSRGRKKERERATCLQTDRRSLARSLSRLSSEGTRSSQPPAIYLSPLSALPSGLQLRAERLALRKPSSRQQAAGSSHLADAATITC